MYGHEKSQRIIFPMRMSRAPIGASGLEQTEDDFVTFSESHPMEFLRLI